MIRLNTAKALTDYISARQDDTRLYSSVRPLMGSQFALTCVAYCAEALNGYALGLLFF